MLPSFVIGLREGLEAALIVGIIAAFLRKQGRHDLVRWVLVGVGIAVLLCLGAGFALRAFSQNLPQKEQEGLETIIAVLAIGMVTYMVVWMRRNSRNLKGQLEGMASEAMAGRSNAGRAMVLMAFLAVIREGLETVVFLLAAFQETSNGATAGLGAVLGIAVAVVLGYGIYRGGVKLNLSKFFRVTGFVLVLVAAGLVVNAFHTAHEAGWVDFGQGRTIDLTWLVEPGTVQASLLTGMLGLQPRPVVVEVVAWLVYLVPVGLYVVWPPGRPAPVKAAVRGGLAVGVLAALAALVLPIVSPSVPDATPTTRSGQVGAQVQERDSQTAIVRTQRREPISGRVGEFVALRLEAQAGTPRRNGLPTTRYAVTMPGTAAANRPSSLPVAEVAALNGSRVPVGIQANDGRVPVTYESLVTVTAWLDNRTSRVLDLSWREVVTVTAGTPANNAELSDPVAARTLSFDPAAARQAADAARVDHDTLDERSLIRTIAGWSLAVAVIALVVALGFWLLGRRARPEPAVATPRTARHELVKSKS